MNIKLSVVLGLMIAGAFPLLSLYAWQMRGPKYDEDAAVEAAFSFLKTNHTKFDWITKSIEVI